MDIDKRPVIAAVDDEAMILHTVAETLEADYRVRPFTSGATALRYLSDNPADLILLDYHLPEMSGFDFLRKFRQRPEMADVPVIFLTGSFGGEAEALELGAVDFIHKPVTPKVLLLRIRHQLELRQHRRNLQKMAADKTLILDDMIGKLRQREEIILNILAHMTDLRDHDTGNHIERTTGFVRIMVAHLLDCPRDGYELTRFQADDIINAAKLHDLGKVALPDDILRNKGCLSQEEFAVVRTHPVHAEKVLDLFIRHMDDPFLNTAREIARAHHERWDGTGYPNGLKEREIPLSARIVAVADVYDAITTQRPYKEAFPHETAMRMIMENSGKHFDPYLTEVFVEHGEDVSRIARGIVDNGRWLVFE
ncbi:MAG: response regulator [Desulfovibrio sp.]|jgi:putative two-component system response regulator|nr:response regulator [Desulfovibrio sp.]